MRRARLQLNWTAGNAVIMALSIGLYVRIVIDPLPTFIVPVPVVVHVEFKQALKGTQVDSETRMVVTREVQSKADVKALTFVLSLDAKLERLVR